MKISSQWCFVDLATLVGAVFFAGGVFSCAATAAAPLLDFVWSEVCVRGSSFQSCWRHVLGRFRRRVCSCWYGECFDLIWFDWFARCSSKRMWRYWCIVRDSGWLGVWCLVFGFGSLPFHPIPSVSTADEFAVCCLLAQSEAR